MAKTRLPLLSLEARGAIGEAVVYFPWKGINAVREYVVPANPRTTLQNTQRGYVTKAVTNIHSAQTATPGPLILADATAYSLYAGTLGVIMTWFNAAVRQFVKQRVAAKKGATYRAGAISPGAGTLTIWLRWTKDADSANDITAGTIFWGTSVTAMLSSMAADVGAGVITAAIPGLTAGVKYYIQFRATVHADFVGTRSGIYTGRPT